MDSNNRPPGVAFAWRSTPELRFDAAELHGTMNGRALQVLFRIFKPGKLLRLQLKEFPSLSLACLAGLHSSLVDGLSVL